MKIALINENSQVSKNEMILQTLAEAAVPLGHQVFNYGMSTEDGDYKISYGEAGLLAAVLLNGGAVDYVVTGCGTGEGACLAANIYPNVYCGYIKDSTDAFLFSQINCGNAISMPFAKEFGWCAELNLKYVFRELFSCEHGIGYPPERGVVQKEFRDLFYKIKGMATKDMPSVLKNMDQDILKNTISGKSFRKHFFSNATEPEIKSYMAGLL